MWDWTWQAPEDYGTRYDFGFFEVHPSMMQAFYQHRKRMPAKGWVASLLRPTDPKLIPADTELIDQVKWTTIGASWGGVGATGNLQFTRGTIAACWAIEKANRGDEVILVGYDNILIGKALPLNEAFAPIYQRNPGSFPCDQYKGNVTKDGNHDYRIERPVLEHIAAERGVTIRFAQKIW